MDWKRFAGSIGKKPKEGRLSDKSIFDFRFLGFHSPKLKSSKPSDSIICEGILRGFYGGPKSWTCWLFVDDRIGITPVAAHDYDFVAGLKEYEGKIIKYTRDFRTKKLLGVEILEGKERNEVPQV